MAEELDSVARYALSIGFSVRRKTILVEGTTDVDLFQFAAKLEQDQTKTNLLGNDLSIVAAGERERGGASGVIRELVGLRSIARTCLEQDGRQRYRFIGLFDNDLAGRKAVSLARQIDASIIEYKDVFRLHPVMPQPGNLDPGTIQRSFEGANVNYKSLDWELEDLVSQELIDAFCSEYPRAVARCKSIGGKIHRDLTADGKAALHRYIKTHAIRKDMDGVIDVLLKIRLYLNLPVG